jgi:hypothetical protein
MVQMLLLGLLQVETVLEPETGGSPFPSTERSSASAGAKTPTHKQTVKIDVNFLMLKTPCEFERKNRG